MVDGVGGPDASTREPRSSARPELTIASGILLAVAALGVVAAIGWLGYQHFVAKPRVALVSLCEHVDDAPMQWMAEAWTLAAVDSDLGVDTMLLNARLVVARGESARNGEIVAAGERLMAHYTEVADRSNGDIDAFIREVDGRLVAEVVQGINSGPCLGVSN
jgi:hypothetical protein